MDVNNQKPRLTDADEFEESLNHFRENYDQAVQTLRIFSGMDKRVDTLVLILNEMLSWKQLGGENDMKPIQKAKELDFWASNSGGRERKKIKKKRTKKGSDDNDEMLVL